MIPQKIAELVSLAIKDAVLTPCKSLIFEVELIKIKIIYCL